MHAAHSRAHPAQGCEEHLHVLLNSGYDRKGNHHPHHPQTRRRPSCFRQSVQEVVRGRRPENGLGSSILLYSVILERGGAKAERRRETLRVASKWNDCISTVSSLVSARSHWQTIAEPASPAWRRHVRRPRAAACGMNPFPRAAKDQYVSIPGRSPPRGRCVGGAPPRLSSSTRSIPISTPRKLHH